MGMRLPAEGAFADVITVTSEGVPPVPIVVCATPARRLVGLRPCGFGAGALFRARTVHGTKLATPITAVGLDREGRVLEVATLHPGRRLNFRGAAFVLELPTGVDRPRQGATVAATPILGECPAG